MKCALQGAAQFRVSAACAHDSVDCAHRDPGVQLIRILRQIKGALSDQQ